MCGSMDKHDSVRAIAWDGHALKLLDQRHLPLEEQYITCTSAEDVAAAIRDMVVRGAPAIGISAAYGVVLAARAAGDAWLSQLEPAFELLAASRPTAVNLFWALDRMRDAMASSSLADLEQVAIQIHEADHADNLRMGDFGAAQIPQGTAVYTHCNTGSLATAGYGTALGVIRSAYRDGLITQVYAGETRPWLQGARLTAWELMRDQIPVDLVVDSAAGSILRDQNVSWVIVGADRVCRNGDVANKIGTYNLAVLAKHHGVKFMVAAPLSTIDVHCVQGADIEIEQRAGEEITAFRDQQIAPSDCSAHNPVFDVTPAALIDCLVTEHGCIHHPSTAAIEAHVKACHV